MQSPIGTTELVIGVTKSKGWHVGAPAGQSAFVSQGAEQYWLAPTITV